MDKDLKKNSKINLELEKDNIDKIKEVTIIINSLIKIIIFISILIGGIYLLAYLIEISFLPSLSTENVILLSIIYFSIGAILIFPAIIIIILPSKISSKFDKKLDEIIKNKPKNFKEKIRNALLTILLIYGWTIINGILLIIATAFILNIVIPIKIFLKKFFIMGIISLIVVAFLIKFYQIQKNILNKIYFIVFLSLILLIFSITNLKLQILIPQWLKIGEYNESIYIKNINLCKEINLTIDNQHICKSEKNNTKILWNFGKKYLIKINNTIYKIPSQYILTEYFPDNKQNKKNPLNNTKSNKNNNQKRK